MKPISEFIVKVDLAEKDLKQSVVDAFKAIDEAKVKFIDIYNSARVEMETDVAQREQCLRDTIGKAVEALNDDKDTEKKSEEEPDSEKMPDAPKL